MKVMHEYHFHLQKGVPGGFESKEWLEEQDWSEAST